MGYRRSSEKKSDELPLPLRRMPATHIHTSKYKFNSKTKGKLKKKNRIWNVHTREKQIREESMALIRQSNKNKKERQRQQKEFIKQRQNVSPLNFSNPFFS